MSKRLRACLMCSFVASASEFRKEGCPNCDNLLEMKGSMDKVLECTTGIFDGTIALIDPRSSWVAKWQRNDKHLPGVYAVRITGELPAYIVEDLESRGVTVRPRNQDE